MKTQIISSLKKTIFFLTALIIILTIVGCYSNKETKAEATMYALTTKVIVVDYETDTVLCEDYNGNIWKMQGCSDWMVGDIATMLMSDKGTPIIYDDEIIRARYQGGFESWKER